MIEDRAAIVKAAFDVINERLAVAKLPLASDSDDRIVTARQRVDNEAVRYVEGSATDESDFWVAFSAWASAIDDVRLRSTPVQETFERILNG